MGLHRPEFYNVTLFGAAAETAANELNKGDRVSIEGRPQLETFDRRDGTAGAAIKVYARKALKIDDSAGTERATADRDVNNGEPIVRIDDPDNPLGPPAYEGPASAAHTRLTPGIYTASTFGDGVTSFEATEAAPIRVRVTGTSSYIAPDPATTSPGPDAGASPRIHHTADATAVVGVGRTAAALHKTLKDNGFRWSTATTSWNLPKDMDEHTRAARVSELLSTVRANGRDLPVVNRPRTPGRPVRLTGHGRCAAGRNRDRAAPACRSVAVSDPDSWAESRDQRLRPTGIRTNGCGTNDVRIYLYETLQDDYKLEPAEAD